MGDRLRCLNAVMCMYGIEAREMCVIVCDCRAEWLYCCEVDYSAVLQESGVFRGENSLDFRARARGEFLYRLDVTIEKPEFLLFCFLS